MIKNIVLQHLHERDQLASQKYIERISQQEKDELLNTNLIKIITGPRRAGKSVCGFLILKDTNFAYINFDDDILLKNYSEDELIEAIHQVYSGFEYIFFDEIQNIPNWELLVNKLHRRNYNLILTGSNARLLSKELATSLTGRFIAIEIFPFSFKEYCSIKSNAEIKTENLIPAQKGELLSLAFQYLNEGGFPECIQNQAIQKTYLSTLFDSVLYKDIVKRFNIRNTNQINDLAIYLLSNYTSPYTFNSLCTELNFKSVASLQKYIGYLEEPYLFVSLSRFSYKMALQKKTGKKIYIIDNGFIKARSFEFSPNYGRLLENLFCIELLRRGYKPDLELFYYKTKKNLEVDFVIRKNIRIQALIQVAYDVSNTKTLNREIAALSAASAELKVSNLFLINWDMEQNRQENNLMIKIIPFWKFALEHVPFEETETL
jgi:predicted AAA+ superfamily ATPase